MGARLGVHHLLHSFHNRCHGEYFAWHFIFTADSHSAFTIKSTPMHRKTILVIQAATSGGNISA